MSAIAVQGLGAVSPAGWGVDALVSALDQNTPIEAKPLVKPGSQKSLFVRSVPAPFTRPAFLGHARLRRASPISHYVVAAGLEALGENTAAVQNGSMQLGIIVCVMTGSVAYSRRFYEEVLKNPATASPLIFPETVFNAPASHLGAYLNATTINYTMVGDDGTFLQGLALAAQWLLADRMDACLVIGAEETDWIISDALHWFDSNLVHASGAGAMLLKKSNNTEGIVELTHVTDSFAFTQRQSRESAAAKMRAQFERSRASSSELLCHSDSLHTPDSAELSAWQDWTGNRLAPKSILGEGFTASAAWQCVAACHHLRRNGLTAANVSVLGANQQAIGARFTKSTSNS